MERKRSRISDSTKAYINQFACDENDPCSPIELDPRRFSASTSTGIEHEEAPALPPTLARPLATRPTGPPQPSNPPPPPPNPNSDFPVYDIGNAMGKRLNDEQKLQFLTNPWIPSEEDLPSFATNRVTYRKKWQMKWLEDTPWLAFSKKESGGLCKYCVVFDPKTKENVQNFYVHAHGTTFNEVSKMKAAILSHEKTTAHLWALEQTGGFLSVESGKQCNVQIQATQAAAVDPFQHYYRNIWLPFVDHFLSELNSRFTPHGKTAMLAQFLVPEVMALDPDEPRSITKILKAPDSSSKSLFNALEPLFDFYSGSIEKDEIQNEVIRWKRMWSLRDDKPSTLPSTLLQCPQIQFPNLHELLKILVVIPVSTAECERTFSTLRRLKNYLRSTMSQERLAGLMLMNIHLNKQNNVSLSAGEMMEEYISRKTRRGLI